jgi:hypothetical protein
MKDAWPEESDLRQLGSDPGVSWGFVLGVLVGFLPAFAVVDFGVVGSSEQGEAG